MLGFLESEDAELRLDRAQVKAIMLDILVAGLDTSSTTIEWVLSELLKHPEVMKKVQKELEEVVGTDRVVEESDLERLKYLDMVVKETMRLHPVGPLMLPHQAMEDCVINGFHIPKKSRIIINVWAIGRDPNVWRDAEKFMPERFVGSEVDVRGKHFQLLPFGSGRRSCPGMQLGLTVVRLVVAQLMHCFDWKFQMACCQWGWTWLKTLAWWQAGPSICSPFPLVATCSGLANKIYGFPTNKGRDLRCDFRRVIEFYHYQASSI